jgi:L-malate glycosyltransferase
VRVSVGLAEQLGRHGHAVHVFSRAAPLGLRRFPDGVTYHGALHAPRLSPQLDLKWSRKALATFTDHVWNLSRELRLEVLHFHYALPFAHVAAQIRRRAGNLGPSVIGTLHGTDVRPECSGEALKRNLRTADVLTTV